MSLFEEVGNFFTGSKDKRRAQDQATYQRQLEKKRARKETALRESQRQTQLGLVGQWQAPKMSDANNRRIAALESESKDGPLVSDALFQGDRAALVQGGQAALSGVQNTQAASGGTGGFSNQGSMSDVYDRMGAQMADLGQRSRSVKEDKRNAAADMRQSAVDAEIAFANAQNEARRAIEAGDYAAAQAAMDRGFAARSQISQQQEAANSQIRGKLTNNMGVMLGQGVNMAMATSGQSGKAGNPMASGSGGGAGPYSSGVTSDGTLQGAFANDYDQSGSVFASGGAKTRPYSLMKLGGRS